MDIKNFYAAQDTNAPLSWFKLKVDENGENFVFQQPVKLRTKTAGVITVEDNKIFASDTIFIDSDESLGFEIPNGKYTAVVTIADVSDEQDGSHDRSAYLSLILNTKTPVSVKAAVPTGEEAEPISEDKYWGFGVDAGTGCFYLSAEEGQEHTEEAEELMWAFIDEDDYCLTDFSGEKSSFPKIFGSSSGWGDGFYGVYFTYDELGEFLGVHIDYQVVRGFSEEEKQEFLENQKNEENDNVKTEVITAKKETFLSKLKMLLAGNRKH